MIFSLGKKIECDARSGILVARTSYSYIQGTRQKTRHMAAGSGREGNGEKEKKEGSKPHTAKQDAKAEAAASRATMWLLFCFRVCLDPTP